MAEQLLRNADIEPTAEIIAAGLGAAYNVYTAFIKRLKEYDVSLMDWRYYNDGKAWLSKGEYKWTTARGTNKVKPLFWLSVWEGFFRVSFFFSEKAQSELLELPISKNTQNLITNAEIGGKTMKHFSAIFDVSDEKQLDDIFVIMNFRKENI